MKFDTDFAPSRVFLDRYLYEDFRPLIKLWIDENGRELLSWDDFIQKSSQAKAKAKIQNIQDLDQYNPWDKRSL